MKDALKNETETHIRAFMYYYLMGKDRTYESVAEKLGVTKQSIYKWSQSFNWMDRIKEYDSMQTNLITQEIGETLAEVKSKYTGLIKQLIDTYMVRVNAGQMVGITNVNQLEKLMRLNLEILGETDRQNDNMINKLAEAIELSKEMFNKSDFVFEEDHLIEE